MDGSAIEVSAKGKGNRSEYKTIALLEAAGYSCTRSGASLGVWDVIGIGSKDVVLVQVKSNRWPLEAEMETLRNFVCPMMCRKLVHRWRDRVKLPDVKEL